MSFNKTIFSIFSMSYVIASTDSLSSDDNDWVNVDFFGIDEGSSILIDYGTKEQVKSIKDTSLEQVQVIQQDLKLDLKYKIGSKANIDFFYQSVLKNYSLSPIEQDHLICFIFPFLESHLTFEKKRMLRFLSKKMVVSTVNRVLFDLSRTSKFPETETLLIRKTFSYMFKKMF